MTFLEREDWKGFVDRYMPVPSVSHGFVEGWAAQAGSSGRVGPRPGFDVVGRGPELSIRCLNQWPETWRCRQLGILAVSRLGC